MSTMTKILPALLIFVCALMGVAPRKLLQETLRCRSVSIVHRFAPSRMRNCRLGKCERKVGFATSWS